MIIVAAASAHAQPLKERVEHATVLAEYPAESGFLWKTVAAKDRFVEDYEREDSVVALLRDYAGRELSRFADTNVLYQGLAYPDLSPDGSALILSYADGIESFRFQVIDSGGIVLFEDSDEILPASSPSGRYFLRPWGELGWDWLSVRDRHGTQVVRLPITEFDARFVNDSLLFYADPDSAGLINLSDRTVLWSKGYDPGSDLHPPATCVSQSHSVAAVYKNDALVLYSLDGTEQWRQRFAEHIMAAAIDPSLPWMVLLLSNPRDSVGYLRVISLSDPDTNVSSKRVESLTGITTRQYEYLWMDNGFIWLLGPGGDIWCFDEGVTPKTSFAEFDGQTHSLTEPVMSSGFYYRVARSDTTITFLRAEPGKPARLVSIRTAGNNK